MNGSTSDHAPISATTAVRIPELPALGRPLLEEETFEHGKEKHDGPSDRIAKGETASQKIPGGVESPASAIFTQEATYPPTALSSEYGSRFSKPDTEIVTPTLQDRQEPPPQTQGMKGGHAHPHPVKSFSLPPWAINSHHDTSPSHIRRDVGEGISQNPKDTKSTDRNAGTNRNGEKRGMETHGMASFVTPSSPLVESPFGDDAAIQDSPTAPRRILPSGVAVPREPQSTSPTADYFPSMLTVQTDVDGAAGPTSATSDPYTMHRTLGNDPIYQHTIPNTPRQLHPRSLSVYLAQHPNDTAKRAVRKTYPKPNPLFRFVRRFKIRHDVIKGCSEQEMTRFEKKEGKKRRRLAGWRLAEEDTEEDKFAEDGVERPVVSELFWKVSSFFDPHITSLTDYGILGLHVNHADT